MQQPIAFADEFDGTEFRLLVHPDGHADVTVVAVDPVDRSAFLNHGGRRVGVKGRRRSPAMTTVRDEAASEWSYQVRLPDEMMARIHALPWPTPERLPEKTAEHERVESDCLAMVRAAAPVAGLAVS